MTSTPIKVAIYVRVSTEEQAEHGYSIEAQLETLRNYCELYGKEIYEEYVDAGVSGKSIEGRNALQRLLKDAERNLFQEVLVWRLNRLARNSLDLLTTIEQLKGWNITFRSFTENFETETPTGKLTLQMMSAIGEFERNTIVENVKMGMKQREKTGKHNGKLLSVINQLMIKVLPQSDQRLLL
jgi:site-specific DNA recombinase